MDMLMILLWDCGLSWALNGVRAAWRSVSTAGRTIDIRAGTDFSPQYNALT